VLARCGLKVGFDGESSAHLSSWIKEQVQILWRMKQQTWQKLECFLALGQPEIGKSF
jgi:hypothetical protein